MNRGMFLGILVMCLCAGCSTSEPPASTPSTVTPTVAAAPNRANQPKIVLLGDSITAGFGLSQDKAYPAVLQQKIDAAKLDFEIVNAGVSGDTTAGGLRRIDWALRGDVRVLVIELGGNDGLRGLPVADMKANLSAIIEKAKAKNVTVVLTGMEAPPNYGPDYTKQFHQVFVELAKTPGVILMPFILEGVGGNPELNQPDGIHPNETGAAIVAENLWKTLQPLLTGRPVDLKKAGT